MLAKIIYLTGVYFRSPEIFQIYRSLKNTEKWSLQELRTLQLQKLKRMVSLAYEKSKYYRNLYDSNNIKPVDIATLSDLKKIPCISKNDLLANRNEIQNRKGYRRLFYSETSGTTGQPLVFYRDSIWDASTRSAQLRGYSWYGVNPWDRNGYFWGYSFDFKKKAKIVFQDLLLNRFRTFSYDREEIRIFSKKMEKAVYLEGYSSMIYEAAKLVMDQNCKGKINLKMVKGTSETIFDRYQQASIEAFGRKIVSEYGSSETGIIAFECPKGNMHVVMENVIVEVEAGEVIVTNLVSDSFPIIRYKLGDAVNMVNNSVCPCGMKHEILGDVSGRVGSVIYGKQKTYPRLTLYYVFKNMAIKHNVSLNYQGVQNEAGKIDLLIEQQLNQETQLQLQSELDMYFGEDVNVVMLPGKLVRDYTHKFKDFISNIPSLEAKSMNR